jgi:hypothetical protein
MDHISLFFYYRSVWLYWGNILKLAFELRDVLCQYSTDLSHDSAYMFNDSHFIMKVEYLNYYFEKLNTFNTSLQGDESNTFQLSDNLKSFIKKYEL